MGRGVGANPGQCQLFLIEATFFDTLDIIFKFIQVMFESEEPHFYTGDLSDSAALLVMMTMITMMMILRMT